MTTIIVDRATGVMAADRRVTTNDCDAIAECSKITRGPDSLIASAGHEGPAVLFEEWWLYGDWSEPLEPVELDHDYMESFSSIILTSDREILVADRFMRPVEVDSRFYCAGSGGPFAWGALQAGCGVIKAIEAAMALDPNSGNGYDLEEI